MKLLEVKGYDPADIPEIRETGEIVVTGYDTGLPHDDVVKTLRNHLSSCGEITDVYIPRYGDKLNKYAFIYFTEKPAVDKALQQLNGQDLDGWKAEIEAVPVSEFAFRCILLSVRGFDTSLDRNDIKIALTKHFSSCGTVRKVVIPESSDAAMVNIVGENAAQKALKLGVSSIQGRKVAFKMVSTPINPTVHKRRRIGFARPGKNAAMTAK